MIDDLLVGQIDIFAGALAHEIERDLKLPLGKVRIAQSHAVLIGGLDDFLILEPEIGSDESKAQLFVAFLFLDRLVHACQ